MGLIDRDDGWRIPDWLWERVEPLLPPPPPHPLGTHRRRIPDRQVMNAILLVLRTGMQWNALAATGICNSSSAHRRFQEWERAGVFHEIWRQGLLDYDEVVGIDWSWLAADGAMTKAPLGGSATSRCPPPRRSPAVPGARSHERPRRAPTPPKRRWALLELQIPVARRAFHCMPVRNTNRMAFITRRSGMRAR